MKPSVMFNFVRRMYSQGRCDEAYVLFQVEMNRLRQDEADEILGIK